MSMHWTRKAIEELDAQAAKHGLLSDLPLVWYTEKVVAAEEGREVHAADVREVGEKYGPHITAVRLPKAANA